MNNAKKQQTFACPHMTIAGVTAASCGTCGEMAPHETNGISVEWRDR